MQEAYWRSATSRSYYAVFGEIRYILEDKGYKFRRTRVHSEVIRFLKSSPFLIQRKTGLDLDRLRRERNKADYDGNIKLTRRRARKSYQLAKGIEKVLPKLL